LLCRARNLFFEGMHDAAAVQRSRQFIELGELFDALVGLLQFQTSAVERFLQGTAEQPDSHGTAKHQNENQQGCEALERRFNRQSDGLVGQHKQHRQADGGARPSDDGLTWRRTYGGECVDNEDRAKEQAADFRRDVGERQHDRQADAGSSTNDSGPETGRSFTLASDITMKIATDSRPQAA
jgi:hypothetical protein